MPRTSLRKEILQFLDATALTTELTNRAENSHLPTRRRERVLQRSKSAEHAQRSCDRSAQSATLPSATTPVHRFWLSTDHAPSDTPSGGTLPWAECAHETLPSDNLAPPGVRGCLVMGAAACRGRRLN